MKMNPREESTKPSNFIKNIIEDDLKTNKYNSPLTTRFPPEPNGYLHIGHAKSICINFGLADEYNGTCNLRFDDTNPTAENVEYTEAIMRDVKWLGFDWGDRLFFASDYYERLYECAVELIKKGCAYVDDLSAEEIREYRGSLTEPGKNSPWRDRTVEENLALFAQMREGEFEDGSRVLRAKIDMSSPNINLRDPAIYRIKKAHHHRTGDAWCIYPMYDFAHGLSDSFERITHSLCTLEFEDHRPLYDWFLDKLDVFHPGQTEFAPLNLSYTITSKRKLRALVEGEQVSGWDDPRMPTLAGMRRRGFSPRSIRNFCEAIGVAKADSIVDISMLEHSVRDDLNKHAARVMAVLNPVKVVITNYPENQTEMLDAKNNPEDPEAGTRPLAFSRELYIERDDFREEAPRKFFRMVPGREVRLKFAYYVMCNEVIKDPDSGEILEIHCTYDPETRGGWSEDKRKVKGTLHWVSAADAVEAEVRLYDRLFTVPNPNNAPEGKTYVDMLNPDSVVTLHNCFVEKSLVEARPGSHFQFERLGYFCVDSKDASKSRPVFNRTVSLRDSWAKMAKKQGA